MPQLHGTGRVSATMHVVNILKDAIQHGEYKVGEKLPNEAELAKQIGVGRSTLRESMRILATYGMVEIKQGEGTFVTNNFAEQVFDFMGFLPDKQNFTYLNQLRLVFEVGGIRMVCNQGVSAADIQELELLVKNLEDAETAQKSIQADAAFHEKIISLTENPLSLQIYQMMSKMLFALMKQLMGRQNVLQDAQKSHRDILEALRTKDTNTCVLAMENHLKKVAEYTEQYIEF